MVTLPVILILFCSWFLLLAVSEMRPQYCAVIACAMGWIYWDFALVKWIRWALQNGIDQNRLLKIGKRNLLLMSHFQIKKEAEKLSR